MKKVLMVNLDVGSGIEYCGNIFTGWLREREDVILEVIKDQNPSTIIVDQIIKILPDIIVLNEQFDRVFQAVYYYKKFNPRTKVLLLNHSWKNIMVKCEDARNDIDSIKWQFNRTFFDETCDIIINLNCKPKSVEWPLYVKNKMIDSYFPVDQSFMNSMEWSSRKKMFLIFGSIGPLRISEEFISSIDGTNLHIDCYGRMDGKEEYMSKFNKCKELVYKGIVPQEKVSDVLNQYKYFIMPHNGTEIFNISLLQAILCGTIPVVCNDRNSKNFDYTWIDWADGLYFGCYRTSDLVHNLLKLSAEKPDLSEVSNHISKLASEKFSYKKVKLIFSVAMKYLMEDR